jgi:hypothetical protein
MEPVRLSFMPLPTLPIPQRKSRLKISMMHSQPHTLRNERVGMRVFQGEISTGGTQRKETMYVSDADVKTISPEIVFRIFPRISRIKSYLLIVPMTHSLILMMILYSLHFPPHFTFKIQGVP